MAVFDDLSAEEERLESILLGLSDAEWRSESGAAGWTVADVVLHLAQSEEGVVASTAGADLRSAIAARSAGPGGPGGPGGTVNDRADELVRAERAAPTEVFARWRQARRDALDALRAADPQQPLTWVAGPVKPATLATTRLAEHWAHGLDITGPLGIDFADNERLRHIAWLAHRTLPYALTMAGEQPTEVRCELTAPDGTSHWTFGPENAGSSISGQAGAFCRVGAQRLSPEASGLRTTGPHGATALRVLRTYAV
ncbi:MAG: maleylpyruvate isomerase family mycothiol-dependent enzyme [Streptosporangiaceae bacterium]|nr:maleylpyruvate isomerase family mycothiol-dependent enzyme [Streptosporangiaceae bacterium]